MPSCAIRKCKNYTSKCNKSSGVTFHRFPEDELRREKWVAMVRMDRHENDWMPTVYSRICSDHFEKDMMTTKDGRRNLNKNALPLLTVDQDIKHDTSQPGAPDIGISDSNSIFDSPAKCFLKKKLEKVTIQKQKLIITNKMLHERNKRLLQKYKSMTKILKNLKEQLLQKDNYRELTLKAEAVDFQESLVKIKCEFDPRAESLDIHGSGAAGDSS